MNRMLLPALLVVSFCANALVAQDQPAPRRPNIVLIISDDQGWGDYSFMKHEAIQTPNIDRLAKEGLTFRRGYVPSSLCRPSLVSMITGLFPHQHKITSNDPPKSAAAPANANPPAKGKGKAGKAEPDAAFLAGRAAQIAYIDKSPTLPRLMAEAGYTSFQTGKWWEADYKRGGFTDGMTLGQRHGDAGLTIGRQSLQPIYDFVDKSVAEKKPFFVWYAPFLPHSPHNPPDRLLEKYLSKAPTREIAKYWAMCEWLDETCGELRAFLEKKGVAENTLTLYVTDNGWIQDPNADRYAPRSKQSPYDGGLRTPIIAHWPGKIAARESAALASSLDLAPTILNAVGLKPTADMPGLNLLDDAAVSARQTIFGEIFTHNAVDVHSPASSLRFRWIIDGHLKLIVPTKANEPQAVIELFDLATDPHEKHNLATSRPDDVQRLTAKLDAWWTGKDK